MKNQRVWRVRQTRWLFPTCPALAFRDVLLNGPGLRNGRAVDGGPVRDIRWFWLGAVLALALGLIGTACQSAPETGGVRWNRDPDWQSVGPGREPGQPEAHPPTEQASADGAHQVEPTTPSESIEAPAERQPSEALFATADRALAFRPGTIARADGRIETLNGRELTLTTRSTARRVVLTEAAQLEAEGPGTRSDPRPGLLAAVAARPDGVASSIRLYPPGYPLEMVRAPLVGAGQGEILTTGLLTAVQPSAVVLSSLGHHFTFIVQPETLVWKPVPLAVDSLAPGQRLLVSGERGNDGVLVARVAFVPSEHPPLVE